MHRIPAIAFGLVVGVSVFASNFLSADHPVRTIATTGRILKVNSRNRTLVIRGSEGPAIQNRMALPKERSPRIAIQLPGMTWPGGILFPLPGTAGRLPQPTNPPSDVETRDDYIVVTTCDTLFQDGSDPIRFEDFKVGETISIHGVLKDTTLTASRLAKWI
jgi:hypothetical protein